MDQQADRGRVDQAGAGEPGVDQDREQDVGQDVDQDLVEFERLQEIARAKRGQWEAATTANAIAERRETLLVEVLASTVALVNHADGIPQRRRVAHGKAVARRWRRLVRPGLIVLLVAAVGTVVVPWLSAWWVLVPIVVGMGCALLLGGTEQTARGVEEVVARLVEVLVVVAVVAATATVALVPLVPALVLVVGVVAAVVSAVVVAAVAFGVFAVPGGEGQ